MKTLKFDITLLEAFDGDFEKLVRTCKDKGFEAFHYEGDLSLGYNNEITFIPSNLRVDGFLILRGCKNLTTIGDNIIVDGALTLGDCVSLTTIGNNIIIGGGLVLSYCRNLTTIGDNIVVDKFLLKDEVRIDLSSITVNHNY